MAHTQHALMGHTQHALLAHTQHALMGHILKKTTALELAEGISMEKLWFRTMLSDFSQNGICRI